MTFNPSASHDNRITQTWSVLSLFKPGGQEIVEAPARRTQHSPLSYF
jgi:hypothetical protein